MKMTNKIDQVKNMVSHIWHFSVGLNKDKFHWTDTPKNLEVLAATDSSGIVKWLGSRYYVCFDAKTQSIMVEQD